MIWLTIKYIYHVLCIYTFLFVPYVTWQIVQKLLFWRRFRLVCKLQNHCFIALFGLRRRKYWPYGSLSWSQSFYYFLFEFEMVLQLAPSHFPIVKLLTFQVSIHADQAVHLIFNWRIIAVSRDDFCFVDLLLLGLRLLRVVEIAHVRIFVYSV